MTNTYLGPAVDLLFSPKTILFSTMPKNDVVQNNDLSVGGSSKAFSVGLWLKENKKKEKKTAWAAGSRRSTTRSSTSIA